MAKGPAKNVKELLFQGTSAWWYQSVGFCGNVRAISDGRLWEDTGCETPIDLSPRSIVNKETQLQAFAQLAKFPAPLEGHARESCDKGVQNHFGNRVSRTEVREWMVCGKNMRIWTTDGIPEPFQSLAKIFQALK